MKLVIEDSKNSKLLGLYSYIYGESNVICALGNGRVSKFVRGSLFDEEMTIVMDMAYNNVVLIQQIINVLDYCAYHRHTNVHFCPVVCSEYVTAKMLNYYGYVTNEIISDIIELKRPYTDLLSMSGIEAVNIKTIEKTYKAILGKLGSAVQQFSKDVMTNPEKYLDGFLSIVRFVMSNEMLDRRYDLVSSSSYKATKYVFDTLETIANFNNDKVEDQYFTKRNMLLNRLKVLKEP